MVSVGVVVWSRLAQEVSVIVYCALLLTSFFVGVAAYNIYKRIIHPVEGDTSLICVAEIQVDADTVVTVRSWWPKHLTVEAVRANGERIALQNARQWVYDHREKDEQVEMVITEDLTLRIIDQYLKSSEPDDQCSNKNCAVCLDDFNDSDAFLTLADCNHNFHNSCLSGWFCKSSKLHCPVCRKDHGARVPAGEIPTRRRKSAQLTVLSLQVEQGPLSPTSD
jgi:hypothetical protein